RYIASHSAKNSARPAIEDTARGGGAADIGGSFATGTRLAACDGRRPAGASSNAGQAKRG
ncbi:hypothetical protein AB0K71_24480, partial [Streptomyces syringium]|uniref:hypothetical protein n=1 Tax=Streptomyces syringium TaxID=76729 RepID=UPI00343E96EA